VIYLTHFYGKRPVVLNITKDEHLEPVCAVNFADIYNI